MILLNKYFEYEENNLSLSDIEYLYNIIDIYNLDNIFVTDKKLYSKFRFVVTLFDVKTSLSMTLSYNLVLKNIYVLIPKKNIIIKLKENTATYSFYKQKIILSFNDLLNSLINELSLKRDMYTSIYNSNFRKENDFNPFNKLFFQDFNIFMKFYKDILVSYEIQYISYLQVKCVFGVHTILNNYEKIYIESFDTNCSMIMIQKDDEKYYDISNSIESIDLINYVLLRFIKECTM